MGNKEVAEWKLKGVTPADFIIKTTLMEDSWGGEVQHVKSNQICSFSDVLEMTILIQEKLDDSGFPQAFTEKRCWTREDDGHRMKGQFGSRREEMHERKQRTVTPRGGPTFFIRINYQQNASWQGSIQWMEGKSTRFFRSHLEMIMLMQEAVEKSGGVEKKVGFNSWEDAEENIS